MFDFGWSELLLIGAIALIVVGPKDLPGMLRTLGQYAAKARGMAREFQRSMDDAAREADLGDLQKGFTDLRKNVNPLNAAEKWMGDDWPHDKDAPKDAAPKAGDPANAPLPVKPAEPEPQIADPTPALTPSPLDLAAQQAEAAAAKQQAIAQAKADQAAKAQKDA